MVDHVALAHVFSQYFYCYVFIYMLLLTEEQTGETWEPSKMHCSFGNRGILDRKVLSLVLLASTEVTDTAERHLQFA
jgi:hypothetical protein